MTKRDIQLVVDGGYNTVESVAYTPRRVLEQIKGISEQKAAKILGEGMLKSDATAELVANKYISFQARPNGLYNCHRDAPTPK